ncbi:MAG: WhiB family transcriptional regulator [bacterium]
MEQSGQEVEVKQPVKNWQQYAECSGLDTSLFFDSNKKGEQDAKLVCGQCAVRQACLEYAIENLEYGVWGGTTERERGRMKRNRRIA